VIRQRVRSSRFRASRQAARAWAQRLSAWVRERSHSAWHHQVGSFGDPMIPSRKLRPSNQPSPYVKRARIFSAKLFYLSYERNRSERCVARPPPDEALPSSRGARPLLPKIISVTENFRS
jgi:hypothetical protein